MNQKLEETSHTLAFLVNDLKDCLHKADPVEALIIMPLIGQTVGIQNQIAALMSARESKNNEEFQVIGEETGARGFVLFSGSLKECYEFQKSYAGIRYPSIARART